MNKKTYKALWKAEESHAFQGWDFSYLDGRWELSDPPWDYRALVLSLLGPHERLLDMGTGGGEFLLSLHHPYALTSVSEGYPPNVALCRRVLEPLGITVGEVSGDDCLPFAGDSFDLVINRHEAFSPAEVCRVLRRGGYFLTQQVGGQNNRDLSERLIEHFQPAFPHHTLQNNVHALEGQGFEILRAQEAFLPERFYDVGALAFYCRIIKWEFPGFSVDGCYERLLALQQQLEAGRPIEGTAHRFLILAHKK
ncbi:class I SAM-dependent methyltransferase [Harryflintia acetispora]|uniref:Methyltransferase family protein n=1 Tax=Harryflintia acetispora TaxID=1849041 RepID=A0A9X8UJ51_9FIRM|nr:methyltransferase domain-containing protein [Harryflintia acetispora]TCL43256.1 methyltransferase family protein [Harryflintia acetispora]